MCSEPQSFFSITKSVGMAISTLHNSFYKAFFKKLVFSADLYVRDV